MSQILRRTLCKSRSCVWKSTNFYSDYSEGTGSNRHNHDNRERSIRLACIATASTAVLWGIYKFNEKNQHFQVFAAKNETIIGEFRPGLPSYTLEQVSLHDSEKSGIWVVYKQGVYDITKFVAHHPGGDKIMLAAGSSVEPFWLMYAIHKDEKILRMLEDMRIGNISAEESRSATANMADPYDNEPRRHPVLRPASKKPFNAEPLPALLVDSYITPNEVFYVRNHLPVPDVDPDTYRLELELEGVDKTFTMSLEQLKQFPKHTVTATIMCAGNRRSEMSRVRPVKGLSWGYAAIGNATWSGARLCDVLRSLGVSEADGHYRHVQFEGLDVDATNSPYGGSIRLHKAMDPHGDVLLAYEMNGQPLPRDHGFPVRAVVPGVVGARNVKWLGRVVVSAAESDAFWQQRDYKGFSPAVDWDTVDFGSAPAIQELPVVSAVCEPQAGDTVQVRDGHVVARGYAWSGGGQKIIRVDVTVDGGRTWHVADLEAQDDSDAPRHWSWTLWTARIPVDPAASRLELWAKAVDSSYNTQPESFEHIWNLRGVLSNAYHRVPFHVRHGQ